MKNKPILVTTTEVDCRLGLIDQGHASLVARLHGVDWGGSTLLINMDPIKRDQELLSRTLAVCRQYLGTVIHRVPDTANLAAAIHWLWLEPAKRTTQHLHLEPDWILTRDVQLHHLENQMMIETREVKGREIVGVALIHFGQSIVQDTGHEWMRQQRHTKDTKPRDCTEFTQWDSIS